MSFPPPPDGPRWTGPPPAGPPPTGPAPIGSPPVGYPPVGYPPVGPPQGPPLDTPAWPTPPPLPEPSGGVPRWVWVYGAVVAIALVSLGGWLVLELRDPAQPDISSPADLAAAGCTADTRQPDLGGGHLGPEEMVDSAPSLIYPEQPPSSGPHIGQVVRSGVFDVVIDPRITTHNLEHGYVVAWYDVDTSPEDLAALRDWADAGLAGDHPKLVVAQYPIRLPDDADIVLTAWFQRQACAGFDAATADAFLDAHYDTFGEAPERGLPPHVSSGNGVLDPEGQDLLLPPLDDVN